MSVLCVLPARIASERIPRKPLREIAGRTLLEWSWRAASRVDAFDEIRVATDDEEVARTVEGFGGTAVLTDPSHPSGTDRVAEAAGRPGARDHEIVVNFQADEPFLDPETVGRAVAAVAGEGPGVATVAVPLEDERAWRSEAVVKVVRDRRGDALYFSRAPIPHPRGRPPELPGEPGGPWLRHAGLYAFTRPALERWTGLAPSPLEEIERLEQLRALQDGMRIRVVTGPSSEPGVDAPEDLRRAERILASRRAHGSPRREARDERG